jgi:hypothetical protein
MSATPPAAARPLRHAASLLSALALVGCAQAPQPLYHWGSYPEQVYQYLKGDGSPTEQYTALQQQLRDAQAKHLALPPGFYAHMALLEMNLGQMDQAVAHLETEKSLFPESTAYVDWLLRRAKTPKA